MSNPSAAVTPATPKNINPVLGASGNLLDILYNLYDHYIRPTASEQLRLIPDSILLGSFLLALITQSYSFAMLSAALCESTIIAYGLRKLMTFIDLSRTLPSISPNPMKCYPTSWGPSLETLIFRSAADMESGFPSYPVFFLATACSYIVGSLYTQKQELEYLGPQYSSRYYIGLFGSILTLFMVMAYRLANDCDGVGILLLSLIFGILTGILLLFQNGYLFGRDAVNLTGIPLLKSRTKDGKPLYICTTKGNV